jgi:hypothetical protein
MGSSGSNTGGGSAKKAVQTQGALFRRQVSRRCLKDQSETSIITKKNDSCDSFLFITFYYCSEILTTILEHK